MSEKTTDPRETIARDLALMASIICAGGYAGGDDRSADFELQSKWSVGLAFAIYREAAKQAKEL